MPIKKSSTTKWDPIIMKLIETKMKNPNPNIKNSTNKNSIINKNTVNIPKKRRSQKEFQKYLHEIFNQSGPTIKYQNPDTWY